VGRAGGVSADAEPPQAGCPPGNTLVLRRRRHLHLTRGFSSACLRVSLPEAGTAACRARDSAAQVGSSRVWTLPERQRTSGGVPCLSPCRPADNPPRPTARWLARDHPPLCGRKATGALRLDRPHHHLGDRAVRRGHDGVNSSCSASLTVRYPEEVSRNCSQRPPV
jgi:hypothetical protein